MHLSLSWLNDFVDLADVPVATIAHELTMKTALIEGVVDQGAALDGVVVGRVLSADQHPAADRLTVCEVDAGGETPAHVVCGAPNVAAGQAIVYAPVGTRLPNGLKLKKAKIRGEASEGMICAEDEIGLGPEHDGILVLPDRYEPGTPIGAVAELTDVVFEIDNKSVTHRPDLWGHYGFARELALIFGKELAPLEVDTTLTVGDAGPAIALEAGEACPLYAGLCIEDAPSRAPDWMRFRLVACGMRPLGLLVDLSNYVMLELGQPTHPFDRDRLAGDRIIVRMAQPGERLCTLDGETRELDPSDMVIADGSQAVALAGIMGGAQSEVSEETGRVFLESAAFDARTVRSTSSRLGLRSEALARFEKALDPGLAEQAVRRYAALVRRLRPEATVASTFRVAGGAAAPDLRIPLRTAHTQALLGVEVGVDEIRRVLGGLGYGVTPIEGGVEAAVPSWRATRDTTIPEDLIEEVGRILGYDRIPSRAPVGPLRTARRDPLLQLEDELRDTLSRDAGFTESLSYSTVRDETLELVGYPGGEALPRLANALQKDASALRPSPVPEMLAGLPAWLRHGPEVRRFEVGRGYALDDAGEVQESREVVALRASQEVTDGRDLVRALRGVADVALRAIDRGRSGLQAWTPGPDLPWFHATRTARLILEDRPVGQLGAVAPGVLARLGIEGAAALLVLDVRALSECALQGRAYREVLRQPPARIDLAFVVDYGTSTDDIAAAIRAAGPRTLQQVEPFDVYRGPPLGEDERSLAFHLVFQARDRTLTDKDVGKARDRIVAAVEKLGGRLR